MAHKSFDTIVIGAGGMGSATAYELARRGERVLALEQFSPVHDLGSSHGHTRIIRHAYYEHPSYVPLVTRAFARWHDLEQTTGRHLLTSCACLNLGRASGEVVPGVRASASEHRLPVDELNAIDLRREYPQFRLPEDYVGVREIEAGFLYVEDCVRAHLDAAGELGAELRGEEPVVRWSASANEVRVETTRDVYQAARLVITAGPWAGQLLGNLGAPLRLMRQTLLWFEPADPTAFRRDRFPIFLAETDAGAFYGLPMIDPRGVKVARHYGAPEVSSADEIDREVTVADADPVRTFLEQFLPRAAGEWRFGQACIYTLSPDRHFVIGLHPQHANVAFAAGFSGHGFKFAPAIGEVLADLVLEGQTPHDISLFRYDRW